jgi:outer membrane beta-barrel protein
MRLPVVVLVLLLAGALPVNGQTPPAPTDDGSDASTRIDCLEELSDEGYRRKGVQRRDFLKRRRFELSVLGGFYASDVLSSTYTAGGSLAFFPAEDFGLELLGQWSPVEYRLDKAFSSFDRGQRFSDGSAVTAMVGLVFSPFHTKLKLSETRILHGDLALVAGGGRTFHDSVQGIAGQVGLALRIYLGSHLGLRLDVRDFILSQEVLGRGRVSHNVGVLLGLGVWL